MVALGSFTRCACSLGVAALVACSSADTQPLGGPHGGFVDAPAAPGSPSPNATPAAEDAGVGATADASTPAAAPSCTAGAPPSTAPTFTQIYTTYFAPGAPVDCATGGTCHAQFDTVKGAWAYLLQSGQVGTSPPKLVDPNTSWLFWYGGLMPETGTTCNPQAMADLNAWAAAGGKDN